MNGQVTVQAAGTLAGTGHVLGTTVQSGGTIAPGVQTNTAQTFGTLTVQGDLSLMPGAKYVVHADPLSSASDLLQVTGTANLAGSVLHVGPEGGFAVARSYTILTA